jgi:serine/threonine-protein kinase
MSQVYRAKHVTLDREVALKVLSLRRTREDMVARFELEAQALASLDHPNIVRAYDVSREGDMLYLVMEFLPGTDLQRLVSNRGPLPVATAVDVVRQAALGLGHAHEKGWIHRDVKPANLMLTPQGTVKLLDLGLARLYGDDPTWMTRQYGGALGTADFLAPEQELDGHEVDIRADIYSLGATFHFLLTGQPPCNGSSPLQAIVHSQAAPPGPLHLARPDVPPRLVGVIDRMLARKPEDRYQTAAALVEALEPWAALPHSLPVARSAHQPGQPGNALTPVPCRTVLPVPVVAPSQAGAREPGRRGPGPGLWGVLTRPFSWLARLWKAPNGGKKPAKDGSPSARAASKRRQQKETRS